MAYTADTQTQKADSTYIKASMAEALLDKDYEQELAIRWLAFKDQRAMHKLIRAHTRLVVAQAAKFKLYGLPQGDLIQEGNIGLMMAVNRFDPERDVRFSTYASWWIKAQMQDYILRNWSIVRTGTTAAHKSLFFNLRRLRAQIANTVTDSDVDGHLSHDARAKIAKTLNVAVKDVELMETRLGAPDQSFSAPVGISSDGNEREWGETLADSAPNPEDNVILLHDDRVKNRCLKNALGTLDTREREIIISRHLTDNDGITLEALGSRLGVSKERVRQLEARAMGKLKKAISACANTRGDNRGHLDFYNPAQNTSWHNAA